MIIKIAHSALKVKDIERSTNFYTHILGFKEAFKMCGNEGKVDIVYIYIGEGQFIELFPDGQGEYTFNNTAVGPSHMCYQVDDIQAFYNQIISKGITPDTEISKGRSGCLQFWIRDPDGNHIELMQIMPDSLQAKAIAEFK